MKLKSIRLPETDLANLAFRDTAFKTKFLMNWLQPKQVKGSYEPVRRSLGEAANVGLPLIPHIEVTTLGQLEQLVIKECRGNPDLVAMNLAPVRAIRDFIDKNDVEADFLQDLPITLYPNMRYSFWSPILIRYAGVARIVFMDMRRTGRLTPSGLHMAFSVVHERFRTLSTEFESVRAEAWRFANTDARKISVVKEWAAPIPFRDIVADTAETYGILNRLRSAQTPKTGTDDGPLFA